MGITIVVFLFRLSIFFVVLSGNVMTAFSGRFLMGDRRENLEDISLVADKVSLSGNGYDGFISN